MAIMVLRRMTPALINKKSLPAVLCRLVLGSSHITRVQQDSGTQTEHDWSRHPPPARAAHTPELAQLVSLRRTRLTQHECPCGLARGRRNYSPTVSLVTVSGLSIHSGTLVLRQSYFKLRSPRLSSSRRGWQYIPCP